MSRSASLLVAIVALPFLSAVLSACQTPRYKEFESVHGGMSKSEVLAAIGNPDRAQRWHGRDRWEYTLYGHPDGNIRREVHFENGVSTYVGAAIKPAITADEQDRINLLGEKAADEAAALAKDGITIQKFRAVDDDDDSKGKPSTAK